PPPKQRPARHRSARERRSSTHLARKSLPRSRRAQFFASFRIHTSTTRRPSNRLLVISCPSSGPMVGVREELEPVAAHATPEPIQHYVGKCARGKGRADGHLLGNPGFCGANML